MSIDATYDMIQAGQKVRCLVMPFEIDTRGLAGRNETMKMTQAEIDKLAQDASAEVARLNTQIAQTSRRISALEHGGSGSRSDLPEFSVNINRKKGTVGSNPPLDLPRGKRRELSEEPDFDLPEYSVHVDRKKGIVGDDR